MDHMDYWRLIDVLTIEQAAFLIIGQDPENVLDTRGYHPVANAIESALKAQVIKGLEVRRPEDVMTDDKGQPAYKGNGTETFGLVRAIPCAKPEIASGDLINYEIDHGRSNVQVESLKAWLQSKGLKPTFFFPDNESVPGYLSPDHPRFSPSLAAAVKAWQAMEDDNLMKGKTAKIAMENWLESRYKELGLMWRGDINKTAIEEAAKIANWDTKGGAPKTPGSE